jgi:hypothetical protein
MIRPSTATAVCCSRVHHGHSVHRRRCDGIRPHAFRPIPRRRRWVCASHYSRWSTTPNLTVSGDVVSARSTCTAGIVSVSTRPTASRLHSVSGITFVLAHPTDDLSQVHPHSYSCPPFRDSPRVRSPQCLPSRQPRRAHTMATRYTSCVSSWCALLADTWSGFCIICNCHVRTFVLKCACLKSR